MQKDAESVAARLENIESELQRIRFLYERTLSYQINDPETAMMHARKAAEAICRQLFIREYGSDPGSLTLDPLIEKLNARKALPRAISVPMRTIQGYGNFAAHEQGCTSPDSVTPEYIRPCLQALATVITWYFAEQAKPAGPGEWPTPASEPHQGPVGLVRVGDLGRKLGISDAAIIRLARESLSLELRTPSATVTVEQARALTEATRGACLNAAAAFKTLPLEEGVDISFALIPAGSFRMGSPEDEEGHNDDEVLHEVQISHAFYLGRHPVTQAQYQAVVRSNPSYFQGADLPVEMVSWFDAVSFCELLSERTGRKLRLPTEAEWEYACRAGTTTAFHFGDGITTDQANFDGNFTYGSAHKGETRWRTSQVGSFPANAWGLFDMHGNVWEWCSDWYGEYGAEPVVDPAGPSGADIRTLRGGSWFHGPADTRCAQREALDQGRRHSIYGFRVVLEAN